MTRTVDGNRRVEVPAALPVPERGVPPVAVTPVDAHEQSRAASASPPPRRGAGIYRMARLFRALLGRGTSAPVRNLDAMRRTWRDLTTGGDTEKRFGGPVGSDGWIDAARAHTLVRLEAAHVSTPRAELEPILDQRRRVLTAMFNGVCMDVHHRLQPALDDFRAADRMRGWRKHQPVLEESMAVYARYGSPRPNDYLRECLDAGVMQRDTHVLVATSRWFATVPGATSAPLGIPIGDYGRELADALVFAAQVMMGASRKTRLKPAEALKDIVRDLTFQGAVSRAGNAYSATAVEGVISIAQAVAQLTARRVPGHTLDDVLNDTFRPLMQLATSAPFATLAPLTNHGYTPRGPMAYDAHGRAGLPEDLQTMIAAAREGRVIMADGDVLDDTKTWALKNETMRGCPVAFGSPTIGKDGKLTPGEAGLHVLTADFIALTKLYLAANKA